MGETVYVCIPAYNAEKFIKKSIGSVLTQDYQSYKVIVVDDGSKDQTGTICDEFAAKDNRVIAIHKDNGGSWSARQRAIDYIKSTETDIENSYVMFLDADDSLRNNALSTVVSYFRRDNVDMLIFGFCWIKEDGRIIRTFTHNQEVVGIKQKKREIYRTVYCDASYNSLWRKAVKLKAFFNETQHDCIPMYGEDLLYSIDLYRCCDSVNFISDILYDYTIVPGSVTHSIRIDSQVKDYCYVKSCVYSVLKEESSLGQDDLHEFYHNSFIYLINLIRNISVSQKPNETKIKLVQFLRNDTFVKQLCRNVEKNDILINLLSRERYSALISAGKIAFVVHKVKNKISKH